MTPKIDAEFAALIPPLSAEELAGLEASLVEEGCRDALVVWHETGILLDGHNRLRVCQERKIPFRETTLTLADRLEARIWIRKNQRNRRNLTDDQRAMNETGLIEDESALAMRERGKTGGEAGGRGRPKDNSLRTDVTRKLRDRTKATVPKASKRSGISERKIRQAQAVKKTNPEMAEKVLAGTMPLAEAVRTIKRETLVEKLENIETKNAKEIAGVFDVIVIDPPWPMEKIERDERPNQSEMPYPTMSLTDIHNLKIPHAKDCHVWIWTTQKFLPFLLRMLHTRRLAYVCTFVWHKPGGMQPIGLPQYNAEFAVYCRYGHPQFVDTKAFPVCFSASRSGHSEKPEAFYDVIRRVTAGRRLDMFSRRAIEGFESWGNESK